VTRSWPQKIARRARFSQEFLRVLQVLVARGKPFTSEDVDGMMVETSEGNRAAAIGALMGLASSRGEIRRITQRKYYRNKFVGATVPNAGRAEKGESE
jgi:hypothetical protein